MIIGRDGECMWFVMCTRTAIGTTPHPILGLVAVCQRCADKMSLPVTPFTER